jgi:hypothetical protein
MAASVIFLYWYVAVIITDASRFISYNCNPVYSTGHQTLTLRLKLGWTRLGEFLTIRQISDNFLSSSSLS